ncbi:hypothetical protein AB0L40_26305 [Patulibacter sp. NPDC049589]
MALAVIRPALRYSYTREAYVLRVIGSQYGPVFVRAPPSPPEGREDAHN